MRVPMSAYMAHIDTLLKAVSRVAVFFSLAGCAKLWVSGSLASKVVS